MLPDLSGQTVEALQPFMPHTGTLGNPVDLTYSKSPMDYFVDIPAALLEEEHIDILMAYDWPGNVRELENLVMRACALDPDLKRLEVDHLQPEAKLSAAGSTLFSGQIEIPEEGVDFEEIEKALLVAAWEKSGHNQSQGAKLLGLQRQAFIYRLQKHGIIEDYGKRNPDKS